MPNGLSEQNQAHVASPDMCPNMTIWCIGWWVRSRCVPERGGSEPETNFFFFIIITFTPFELLAPTSGLSRILSCRLTNTGIIAISEPYINEMLLHVGMYAPIPSHPDCNTHTQSGWPNTLDDTQLQIFNDLREKFQDIWRAVKVIVAACKNGWGRAHNADGMDAAV
jgi:hypothetical protein